MRLKVSLSRKQVGELYHYTNITALVKILRSGNMELTSGRGSIAEVKFQGQSLFFLSMTRSRFGGFHYREGSNDGVMITLDGDKLSDKYVIKSVDYWSQRGNTPTGKMNTEIEERLLTDKPMVSILPYIKRVDFVQSGSALRPDRGVNKKFVLDKYEDENNNLGQHIGSAILQLKVKHIKYGFFDTIKDWALRRGEYSPQLKLGILKEPKRNDRNNYSGKLDFKALKDLLLALSGKPFEELPASVQETMRSIYRSPYSSPWFTAYENSRFPDANVSTRALAIKIARRLKALGIVTDKDFHKYLGDIAKTADEKAMALKRYANLELVSSEALFAITNPYSDWSDKIKTRFVNRDRALNNLDGVFFSYKGTNAADFKTISPSAFNLLERVGIKRIPNDINTYYDVLESIVNPIMDKIP